MSSTYFRRDGVSSSVRSIRIDDEKLSNLFSLWTKANRRIPLSFNVFLGILMDLGLEVLKVEPEMLGFQASSEYVPPLEVTRTSKARLLELTHGRKVVNLSWFAKQAGYANAGLKEFRGRLRSLERGKYIVIQQSGYVSHSKLHGKLLSILKDTEFVRCVR